MTLACIFPHGVYKKWPLNMLEFSFFLNLCILCIFLGYYKYAYQPLFVSVSLVMLTCFGLLLYHIYQRIKTTKTWNKITKWISVRSQSFQKRKSSCEMSEECDLLLPQSLSSAASFHDYREQLLDDNDDY